MRELSPEEQIKIEEIKKRMAPKDAIPLMKLLMTLKELGTEEHKKMVATALEMSFIEVGRMGLERAFLEGVLTEEEWIGWHKKYGVTSPDIGPVLQAYFNRKDNVFKDEVIVVTNPNTILHKMRWLIKRRFNVKVITTGQALQRMEKESVRDNGR